eukprot:CAMPEP_0194720364 /NCGR_PEP_ID=MMETSP0296-20130528/11708_1 /TAXON_ID=39354 /ORGANISM="Heterosigma akashiwo, Strain CCMP2393" /LENGTH=94 /DNA_ID=CAMNT_0039622503 /DNA_START=87 /DNA_END=367 /DNA_ORIENTATION=-
MERRPYCFDKAEFGSEDFDAAAFINRSQMTSSLEILRNDLHKYLAELKNELYELINRDYADLVAINSKLGGADRRAAALAEQVAAGLRQVELCR